jgi:hypothetical protein
VEDVYSGGLAVYKYFMNQEKEMEEMEKMVFLVKVELTEEELDKFDALIKARCLDRDKYLEKLLKDRLAAILKKPNRSAARAKRTKSD